MVAIRILNFTDRVRDCRIRQQIRKENNITIGRHIQLFDDQSPPVKLTAKDPICTNERPIRIDADRIFVDTVWLRGEKLWEFCEREGFDSPQSLTDNMAQRYGLPFNGFVINWDWDLKNGR